MQNVEWLMGEWVIPLKTVTTTRAPCGANKFLFYDVKDSINDTNII